MGRYLRERSEGVRVVGVDPIGSVHYTYVERGVTVDYEDARERVYGMPYGEWKQKYQTEATPEQLAAFEAAAKP